MALEFEEILPFVEGEGDTGKTAREKIKRNFEKIKPLGEIPAEMQQVKRDLEELSVVKRLFREEYIAVEEYANTNVPANRYIYTNGDLRTQNDGTVKSFLVSKGDKVKLTLTCPEQSQYTSLVYAIYSNEIYSSETVIQKGPRWDSCSNGDIIEFTAEEDGYLAVAIFYQYAVRVEKRIYVSVVDELSESVEEIDSRLVDYENLYVDKDNKVDDESLNRENKKYILNKNGDISGFDSYELIYLPVLPGERYRIDITNPIGGAYLYAYYNTSTFSEFGSQTKVGVVGDKLDNAGSSYNLTVPEGARCLAITRYKGVGSFSPMTISIYKIDKVFFPQAQEAMNLKTEEEMTELRRSISDISSGVMEMCAELSDDGENLYIAYLEGAMETVYWFRKCMANNLFTFYRVGYRTVDRDYPDTAGINLESGIIYYNKTSSDNIGPLSMKNGDWTGGNHKYNNGTVLTAENESHLCYADGKMLNAGDKLYCDCVKVEVVNKLYDPAIAPSEGDTILSTLLATETVLYSVKKNTIEVSLREAFAETSNKVSIYYGMQSFFLNEDYIMTANGGWTNWEPSSNNVDFTKTNYPNINRFIEKNSASQTYQATFLYRQKLGDHHLTDWVFRRQGGKCYHCLMHNGLTGIDVSEKSFSWSGGYTFFHTPLLDDDDVLAYAGVVNGKDAIFINAKRACSINISLPVSLQNRKINVIEIDNNITTANSFTDIDGVSVDAAGVGSLIFTLD